MTDLPARTPLWARCYLRAKDRVDASRVNGAAVVLGVLVLKLALAYAVALPWMDAWLPWGGAAVGIPLVTVVVGMGPFAIGVLVDDHAEQYRQDWA